MSRLQLKENQKKYTDIESCPIRNIISRFSGKWSMLILCILAENEATRFNEIGKAIPDISPKVLTETLRNLEQDGLVARKLYAQIPPRVEYSLTDRGHSLMPHIESLVRWAVDNYKAGMR
ncbi:MAG: helix-turn-helix domain-containing protein [Bacteroidales bacterium]|nr:helix-turn-helix domain-containing protein [Bacteroidales bacterium]